MENAGSMDLEIFRNPFDIPRDELIRNLIYLPVRVATALENRCAQATGQRMRKMKTPLISILESRIASTQKELQESAPTKKAEESDYNRRSRGMLAGSYCQGNNDCVDEVCVEGEIGPISHQERHKRHLESSVGGLAAEELKERSDGVTDGSNKRKRVEEKFRENHCKSTLSEDNSSPRVTPPVTRMETKKQTDFFISTIRVLRNVKSNQSKELFDILSSPNLPVKKAHLVEQLIWMAQEYNKKTLAEELMKYQ